MSFFKRMFSRPRKPVPGKSPSPETTAPMETPIDKTVVPPGHQVTIYRPTDKPGFQETLGGVLIANLGTSSDEFQEELIHISEEIEHSLSAIESNGGTKRLPILIPAEECQISDLYAPNDVKVTPYTGLLVWVMDAGSAHLWLREPEPILAAIRRAGLYRGNSGPITQYVLFSIEMWSTDPTGGEEQNCLLPSGTLDFVHLLADTGASVAAIPKDTKFLIDVSRPDCVLSMLRTEPLPNESEAKEDVISIARAPRLRRLVLAAIKDPNHKTRQQLFQEFLSREIALLVICDPEGKVRQMDWPEIGPALPVFPDTSFLFQAAEDLNMPLDSFGIARFSPHKLFTWVNQAPFGGIALNTYIDQNTPAYFYIKKEQISALANIFNSRSR